VSSSQDDAEVAKLFGNNLVLHAVESEQRGLLHIIEALATLMDGLLGKSDEERHHEHAHHSKHKDGKDCYQIAQHVGLVGDNREGHRITVRALDLLGLFLEDDLLSLLLSWSKDEGSRTVLVPGNRFGILKLLLLDLVL